MKGVHKSDEGLATDANGLRFDPGVRSAMAGFAVDGDTAALETAAAVRAAAQSMDKLRGQGAGGRGLSAGAMDVLVRLTSLHQPEIGLHIGELARAGGVSSRNVTGLVDTLERDGLVRREPDPHDRRSVRVVATPAGTAWLAAFREPTRRAMSAVFRGFTHAELDTFRDFCLRLVENQRRLDHHLAHRPEGKTP
ncbi:MarR family transcriptional regulator [Kitasatospora sp. MMS16-BH015]|uniref:MarR family winged helix-turn-helix transcriptional regulator n=1 Tax=Kitasatospora sp. MMS16-BH015 TaxID=2018025 RepID=UPI000CA1D8B2|nr:MarR family transcriptional regulator [Kitasatospora sp. MMS16-BH015]AUG76043.1 MarR family transcriptional regulator [Kitasatospora sp. MMS16-BH015]